MLVLPESVTPPHCVPSGYLARRVGLARIAHKVLPPSVTGPPEFERTYRAQWGDFDFFCKWRANKIFLIPPVNACHLVRSKCTTHLRSFSHIALGNKRRNTQVPHLSGFMEIFLSIFLSSVIHIYEHTDYGGCLGLTVVNSELSHLQSAFQVLWLLKMHLQHSSNSHISVYSFRAEITPQVAVCTQENLPFRYTVYLYRSGICFGELWRRI